MSASKQFQQLTANPLDRGSRQKGVDLRFYLGVEKRASPRLSESFEDSNSEDVNNDGQDDANMEGGDHLDEEEHEEDNEEEDKGNDKETPRGEGGASWSLFMRTTRWLSTILFMERFARFEALFCNTEAEYHQAVFEHLLAEFPQSLSDDVCTAGFFLRLKGYIEGYKNLQQALQSLKRPTGSLVIPMIGGLIDSCRHCR